jgi:hypothetical protein
MRLLAVEPDLSCMRVCIDRRSTPPSRSGSCGLVDRASDKQCLVVDIEPRGKDRSVTKIGKTVYPTREEAEADVKRLCK